MAVYGGMPPVAQAEAIYWAYREAKRTWRRFSNRGPCRMPMVLRVKVRVFGRVARVLVRVSITGKLNSILRRFILKVVQGNRAARVELILEGRMAKL